jgi:hypothetical protein
MPSKLLNRRLVKNPPNQEHRWGGQQYQRQGIDTECLPYRPSKECSENKEGAVGDIDNVHHSEDQGEARGKQGIYAPYQQAQSQRLSKLVHGFKLTCSRLVLA